MPCVDLSHGQSPQRRPEKHKNSRALEPPISTNLTVGNYNRIFGNALSKNDSSAPKINIMNWTRCGGQNASRAK